VLKELGKHNKIYKNKYPEVEVFFSLSAKASLMINNIVNMLRKSSLISTSEVIKLMHSRTSKEMKYNYSLTMIYFLVFAFLYTSNEA
jgi:ABC-type amino acid transport system permease subunit